MPLCQLSGSLWALARMRIAPPPSWSLAFVAGVQRRLCGFSGQELAALMWALPRAFGGGGAGPDLLAHGHSEWLCHEAVAESSAALQQSIPSLSQCVPGSVKAATTSCPAPSPAMLLSRLAMRIMKRCRQLVLSGDMQQSHIVSCCHASTLMPAGFRLPTNIWLDEQLLLQMLGSAEVVTMSNGSSEANGAAAHLYHVSGIVTQAAPIRGHNHDRKGVLVRNDLPWSSRHRASPFVPLRPQQAEILLCALTRDSCRSGDSSRREAALSKAARCGPSLLRIACQRYISLVQPSEADPSTSSSSSSDGSAPVPQRPLLDAAPPISTAAGSAHPPPAGPMIALLGSAALLRLGPPPHGFMAALQRATYAGRWELSPSQLSALLEALGRLGARPGRSRWLGELLLVLHRQVEQYSTAQLIKVRGEVFMESDYACVVMWVSFSFH